MLFILLTSISFNGFSQMQMDFHSEWTKVYLGSKVGYIDTYGIEIIAPVYDSIYEFGTHKKDWALTVSNGLYGFIDTEGNEIISPQYEQINTFGEYRSDWALVKREGYFGFIDENGHEIVIAKYDRIEEMKKSNKLTQ